MPHLARPTGPGFNNKLPCFPQRQHWTTSTFSGGAIWPLSWCAFRRSEAEAESIVWVSNEESEGDSSTYYMCSSSRELDCSLFTIANAVSLANVKDPTKMKFAQQSMTAFFTDCIKDILTPFLLKRK